MSYAYSPHSSSRSRKLRYFLIALVVLGVGGFFGYRSWSHVPDAEEMGKMLRGHVRECVWELDGEKVDGRRLAQQKPRRTLDIEIGEMVDREVKCVVIVREEPDIVNPSKRIAGAPPPSSNARNLARNREWIYAAKWKYTPPGLRGLLTRGSLDGTIDEEPGLIAVSSAGAPKPAVAAAPAATPRPAVEVAAAETPAPKPPPPAAATPFMVAPDAPENPPHAPKSTPGKKKPTTPVRK